MSELDGFDPKDWAKKQQEKHKLETWEKEKLKQEYIEKIERKRSKPRTAISRIKKIGRSFVGRKIPRVPKIHRMSRTIRFRRYSKEELEARKPRSVFFS